jgi:hypothetical protein
LIRFRSGHGGAAICAPSPPHRGPSMHYFIARTSPACRSIRDEGTVFMRARLCDDVAQAAQNHPLGGSTESSSPTSRASSVRTCSRPAAVCAQMSGLRSVRQIDGPRRTRGRHRSSFDVHFRHGFLYGCSASDCAQSRNQHVFLPQSRSSPLSPTSGGSACCFWRWRPVLGTSSRSDSATRMRAWSKPP